MDQGIVKVAMCQVETGRWAVEQNVERTAAALKDAGSRGCDIAVTPECVIHGYGRADTVEELHERLLKAAEPVDGPNMTFLCETVRDAGMHALIGWAELFGPDTICNSAALIDPDGNVMTIYRKVHCRPFESVEHDGCFTPGDEFKVLDVDVGDNPVKVGNMICFDREIPETVRCLRGLGAEIILCPLATYTSDMSVVPERAHNELVTQSRAAENEVCIVVVNHAGTYNGGSFAVGPHGELISQMNEDPGVEIVELPLAKTRADYQSNPLGWMGWGHRRPQVYKKYV